MSSRRDEIQELFGFFGASDDAVDLVGRRIRTTGTKPVGPGVVGEIVHVDAAGDVWAWFEEDHFHILADAVLAWMPLGSFTLLDKHPEDPWRRAERPYEN